MRSGEQSRGFRPALSTGVDTNGLSGVFVALLGGETYPVSQESESKAMFKDITKSQLVWWTVAFIAGVVLCTATMSLAQPPRADCTDCATCLDEL